MAKRFNGTFLKLFPQSTDALYANLCRTVSSLNQLKTKDTVQRRNLVDLLIELPKKNTNEAKTKWIRLSAIASHILRNLALDSTVTEPPSIQETTEKILNDLRDFKGSTEHIVTNFSETWVINPALYPWALSVAILIDQYGRTDSKVLELGQQYLTDLVQLWDAVLTNKELVDN